MTGSEMGRFIIGFLGIGGILFGLFSGLVFLIIGVIAFFVYSMHWHVFLPACAMLIFAGLGYLAHKYVEYLDRRDARRRAKEQVNAKPAMPIE